MRYTLIYILSIVSQFRILVYYLLPTVSILLCIVYMNRMDFTGIFYRHVSGCLCSLLLILK